MAHFLLLVFVFATQLFAGFSTQKLSPPAYGKKISILSIDGGGIKGIIPATVLDQLDKALKAKDPKASLAEYFDVIAGSSTGGIMTALLAASNPSDPAANQQPFLTPSEIVKFYNDNGPHIFNKSSPGNGPTFDGVYLHNLTGELLKETRLSQTLTKVVIPTFDLKKLKPVIFSSYKLKTDPYLNAKLSDIIIGTSAAPTVLPPYKFKNDDVEFNMIDGGAAADNPAMVAASEVMQHEEVSEILLLSVGTGKTKLEEKYDAETAAHWGSLQWVIQLQNGINSPFLDIAAQSSTDIVPYYLATVFPGFMTLENYLRIQEYDMDPSMNNMTDVTPTNLDNLVKVGNNLLNQKVKRINVNTFEPYEIDQTNAKALESFADKLYAEKHFRLKRKSMEKTGRPFVEAVRVPFSGNQATY